MREFVCENLIKVGEDCSMLNICWMINKISLHTSYMFHSFPILVLLLSFILHSNANTIETFIRVSNSNSYSNLKDKMEKMKAKSCDWKVLLLKIPLSEWKNSSPYKRRNEQWMTGKNVNRKRKVFLFLFFLIMSNGIKTWLFVWLKWEFYHKENKK
jgi:hypothetical protein